MQSYYTHNQDEEDPSEHTYKQSCYVSIKEAINMLMLKFKEERYSIKESMNLLTMKFL